MSNKKILYVWKSPFPWDVRVDKICSTLAKRGYTVRILAKWDGEENKLEKINGFEVFRAGFKKKRSLLLPIPQNPLWKKEISRQIHDFKPDIIIPREIMLSKICSDLAGIKPVVIDMAENYPAAMKAWKKYNNSFFKRLIVHDLNYPKKVEKDAVNNADGIIVVCDEQIDRLNEYYNFDKEKICVVHNTPTNISDENNYLKSNRKKIIFGHHGHLSDEKSIKKFLIAFLRACDIFDDIEFHIYGDGESKEELLMISQGSKHRDKVKFFGRYNFNDLPKILNSFSVGVMPYQINDFNQFTIHNKIFDYYSEGIPVIVSENKPQSRIVKETNSGWIINCENIDEIENSILNLDRDKLEDYSINAFNAARDKYNWESDTQKLIDFIENA